MTFKTRRRCEKRIHSEKSRERCLVCSPPSSEVLNRLVNTDYLTERTDPRLRLPREFELHTPLANVLKARTSPPSSPSPTPSSSVLHEQSPANYGQPRQSVYERDDRQGPSRSMSELAGRDWQPYNLSVDMIAPSLQPESSTRTVLADENRSKQSSRRDDRTRGGEE